MRSAKTGKVLYHVWMLLASLTKARMKGLLLSNWNADHQFRFKNLDKYFNEFPNRSFKSYITINRMRWPRQLSKEDKKRYEVFLQANGKVTC